MSSRVRWLALAVATMAWLAYWLTASLFNHATTPPDAYFDALASAFLHGRLDLISPVSTWDLAWHNGHWYVPFPPLPALLMMPALVLGGVNTTLYCTIMGGLTVGVVFLLFETITARGWNGLSRVDNLWLTALFGFGTVNWWMSTSGSVWYVAQVTTCTFVAIAALLAVRGAAPVAIGSAFAAALCGRPPVVAVALLIITVVNEDRKSLQASARWHVAFASPILIVIGALAACCSRRPASCGPCARGARRVLCGGRGWPSSSD